MRKVILFELNEVPYPIIDEYCRREPGSFLARALPRCTQYTTVAADQVQLDPWITWATLHRGVSDIDHGILHLGQDLDRADAAFPPIWSIVKDAGRSVGVFGSLHSSHVPGTIDAYDFYLPDFFADTAVAHPARLRAFQQFNLAMTRQSARNVDRGIPLKPAMAFLRQAPFLGVSPATAGKLAAQLAAEVRNPNRKIRRRSLQPVVMFDIFLKLLEQTQPDFGTFYSNHVAAAMHRYWAALFPEDYADQPMNDDWRQMYGAEILHAMDRFSEIFRLLVLFTHAHPDYVLVVASSMGQAAIPSRQTFEFLTVSDVPAFMTALGLQPGGWEQRNAMVPCVSIAVAEPVRDRFRERLASLGVGEMSMVADERPVHPLCFDEREGGFFHIFVQADNYAGPRIARLGGAQITFDELGLGMMAHEDGVNCTAQHTPEGSLLVYDPRKRLDGRRRPSISTLDVAPSLLAALDVPIPRHMHGEQTIAIQE